MYRSVTNFFEGVVSVSVESAVPERVINLCSAHRIAFWDLCWLSPTSLRFKVTRRGWRELRGCATQVDAVLTRQKEQGVPVFARLFRRRYALLIGAAAVVLSLLIGSFFIWNFEITGNATVSDEAILRALEAYGITLGTAGFSVDQEDMRNHVLLELADLSWLALNVRGCTAHVQVVERQRPPEIYDRRIVANVVAVRDGLVDKVEALDGVAQVLPGSTVTRGQLLISGVADSERNGLRLLHGMGTVWARTWTELSVQIPMVEEQKTAISKKTTSIALIFGKRRIKIGLGGSRMGSGCDKITTQHPWVLPGGYRLPVTVRSETETRWVCRSVTRTRDEAEREAKNTLLAYLQTQLSPGGSVTDTHFSFALQGDTLLCTLQAECYEQIGQQVLLPTE